MFRPNETWRHISNTEIELLFVKIQYRGPDYIKAKVLYLNRQTHLPQNRLISPFPESVRIKHRDLSKWRFVA